MIYIIIYVFAVFWGFAISKLYGLNTKKGKKYYIIPIFLILCIVSGLRGYNVGTDTCGYVDTFRMLFNQSAKEVAAGTNIEYSHLLFMKALTLITYNPQIYLIATSIIMYLGIGKFLYDNSDNVCISTLVFMGLYFMETMSVIRQYMAIAVACQSIHYLKKGRYWPAVFYSLIALFAHKSIVIFWGIEILFLLRNKTSYFPVVIISSSLMWILYKSKIILTIISMTPYAHYIGSKYMKASYTGGTINIVFLLMTAGSVIVLLFKDQLKIIKSESNGTIWFYISMLVFDCILLGISREYMLFTRFSMFFDTFVLLFIPTFFKNFKKFWPVAYISLACCMLGTTVILMQDYAYEFLVK